MDSVSDAYLMDRLKTKDRQAFAVLIERYRDALVNYLYRMSGSKAKAEDLAQETFLLLYEKSAGYQEYGRFSGYLYRIATNLYKNSLRRERAKYILSLALNHSKNGQRPPDPQQQAQANEINRQIEKAILKVPLRYRTPLVLFEIQGLTYQELADMSGVKIGTIKSRINRGRNILRKILSDSYQGGLP